MILTFSIWIDRKDAECFSKILHFNETSGHVERDSCVCNLEHSFYSMERRLKRKSVGSAESILLDGKQLNYLALMITQYEPIDVSLKHQVKERCSDVLFSVFFDMS